MPHCFEHCSCRVDFKLGSMNPLRFVLLYQYCSGSPGHPACGFQDQLVSSGASTSSSSGTCCLLLCAGVAPGGSGASSGDGVVPWARLRLLQAKSPACHTILVN